MFVQNVSVSECKSQEQMHRNIEQSVVTANI